MQPNSSAAGPADRPRFSLGSLPVYVAIAIGVLGFVWLGVETADRRGPWLDEFWTLWFSQRDVPLGQILKERWLADLHPPLFSALHWIAEPWAGDSIFRHRLLNLLPLTFVVAFVLFVTLRFPRHAGTVAAMLLVWLAVATTGEYLAESRSYFSQMSVVLVLAGSVVVIAHQGSDYQRSRDWPLASWTFVSIAVAFSLNYLAAAVAGFLLLAFGAHLWLTGRRRWFWLLFFGSLVCMVPVAVFVLVQKAVLAEASDAYWVTTSFHDALTTFRRVIRRALEVNELALLVAGLSILGTVLFAFRGRRQGGEGIPAQSLLPSLERTDLALIAVLSTALLSFAALLLAAHLRQPIVTGRYLLAWQILLMAALAVAGSPLWRRYPMLLVLLAVAAVWHQTSTAERVRHELRWNGSLQLLQSQIAACPESEIYAVRFPRPSLMRNEVEVRRWGHEHLAAWNDIRLQFLDTDDRPVLKPTDGQCPTLVWLEHVNWRSISRHADAQSVLRVAGVGSEGFDLEHAVVRVSDTGIVLVLPRD